METLSLVTQVGICMLSIYNKQCIGQGFTLEYNICAKYVSALMLQQFANFHH